MDEAWGTLLLGPPPAVRLRLRPTWLETQIDYREPERRHLGQVLMLVRQIMATGAHSTESWQRSLLSFWP